MRYRRDAGGDALVRITRYLVQLYKLDLASVSSEQLVCGVSLKVGAVNNV